MSDLMGAALKHLAARPCSERELRLLLTTAYQSLKDNDEQIDATITRLKELHLLDDHRMAENVANRYQQKGNRFIQQALRQKGVTDDVILEVLETVDAEADRAFIEAKKKLGQVRVDDPYLAENKLVRFLNGRGFSHDSLKQAMLRLKDDGLLMNNEQTTEQ